MTLHNSITKRLERVRAIGTCPNARAIELEMCRRDPVFWIDRWAWTFDPRENFSTLPFELFPRQAEFVRWLAERDRLQESGLAEKSRDVGFTWLCAAYATHCFLFRKGDSTGFGSRKLDLVDDLDNPDCIFEKLRFLIKHLPLWMRPPGYLPERHAKYCTIVNPFNGSTITGEGGTQIGRGGRKSRYFVDEAAFLPNPKSTEAALSQNTRVRIDVSTPNGTGNPFHTRRFGGVVPVFTFHWRDDPRKNDAWYEREKLRIGDSVIIAQELDIDYNASLKNVCIPGHWVRAAVNLDIKISGRAVAGWDVADEGRCSNVLICRSGPVVTAIRDWGKLDIFQSSHFAAQICRELEVSALSYDCIGVGAGVRGAFNSMELDTKFPGENGFRTEAVNVGDAPTELMWPDGKTSKERFRNLRAELWWLLRCRFEKAHDYALYLAGNPTGREHPLEDMISIPNHSTLIPQLSTATYRFTETGKIQLESKPDMLKRGVASPDFADALALAFAPTAGSWVEALEVATKQSCHDPYENW